MILPQINGKESMVSVLSLKLYIFLSAGHISLVCPIMEIPTSLTISLNLSILNNPFSYKTLYFKNDKF